VPRYVDHDERRREIVEATNRVLSEEGLRGLSFRAVAERLGGSTTLVTHYYSSQQELLTGLATSLVETWAAELEQLEAESDDPRERLMILLEWLIPIDDEGRMQERARINLLAERILGAEIRFPFDAWEDRMRDFIREHLREIVPKQDLEMRVEALRVVANGLTLAAIEHPDRWPPERLLAVLRQLIADMGLAPNSAGGKDADAATRVRAPEAGAVSGG
jgi:AcrR family transcriptional regulator